MKLKMSNRSVKQRKSEEKLIGYVSLSFAYRFLESEGFLTEKNGLIVMKFDQSSDVIYMRHLGERDIGITAHVWRSCGSIPIISCNVFITIRPRKGSCQRDQERY
ncbi:unnamed protein product [Albugo candida]|uniref:Uncharacterized protein n=1 Tax=Albugo candida TaxID=65357 RepID=A0A024GU35_9STRA|nr:unnamed protein product [Albugo candida]|eukprot:CCI49866.1 unnamed protein product [Albugo candida]